MPTNDPNPSPAEAQSVDVETPRKSGCVHGVSWALLLTTASIFVVTLSVLQYNVLYTEGEVMQAVFTLLVGMVAACVLFGFGSRTVAMWCVTLLGGSLLIWQAYQTREWAMLHEDIVAIVRFAEDTRTRTGQYPSSLEGYVFKHPATRQHIYGLGPDETHGFRISYFMNDPGITYWYSSKTGFGYYPD
jgi:hypothetical protein